MQPGFSSVQAYLGVFGDEPGDLRIPRASPLWHPEVHAFDHGSIIAFVWKGEKCTRGSVFVKGRPFGLDERLDLKRADGRFSAVRFDGRSLLLATDILGAGGVYYAVRSRRLYFGSHLGLLMQAIGEAPLDRHGVAALLIASASIGGRTPYQGVSRLEACQRLDAVIDDELRVSVQNYASLPDLLLDAPSERGDRGLKQFGDLLADAVRRWDYTGRDVLMLSGGRDSLALGHALGASNSRVREAFTYGTWQSADVEGARLAARRLGLRHHLIQYGGWDLSTYAGLILDLGGGMSGLQAAHFMVGFHRAEATRAIVGVLGDACTGAHLPNDVGAFNTAPVFPFGDRWPDGLLSEIETEIADLRAELETRYNKLSDLEPFQRHLVLDLTIRQATWISTSFDLCGAFAEISCPFFDRAWMRFMFNLELADLRRQAFYREWISRQKPVAQNAGVIRSGVERLHARAIWTAKRAVWRMGFSTFHLNVDWRRVILSSSEWLDETTDSGDWLGRLSRDGLAHYMKEPAQAAPGFLLAVALHQALRGTKDKVGAPDV